MPRVYGAANKGRNSRQVHQYLRYKQTLNEREGTLTMDQARSSSVHALKTSGMREKLPPYLQQYQVASVLCGDVDTQTAAANTITVLLLVRQ